MAVSKQRSPVPILALTDREDTYRRMCLYWGVTSLLTDKVDRSTDELLQHIVEWGRKVGVLDYGSRVVLVGTTDWNSPGHDLMVVHEVS